VQTIDELLVDVPGLQELSPDHRRTIAGCAQNVVFQPGEQMLREGEPADTFFVVRRGVVALETFVPRHGTLTIETIEAGELLGWSWLFPPFRTMFDARAVDAVHAIAFDGGCLRGKADEDPALGYDLLKVFAAVIMERLQGTRLRLIDMYGEPSGGGR
jgi:CRP-like cAMP-binding protein